ncbi:MAG: hypothetical protein LBU73_08160 [Helicobacteraceae bacterium]|jgi:hypothetical protein|nr:hypothetical protein [Helicobacteraceae bacterium]
MGENSMENEIKSYDRFAFDKNWSDFLRSLKEWRISLSFIFLCIVFFLSGCEGIGKSQVADKPISDTSFVSGLTERRLGDSPYLISIPADYAIEVLQASDFVVYYIKPTDAAKEAPFAIGIYFGNHPNPFPPQNESCREEQHKTLFLETNAKWTIYNCGEKRFIQTLIDNKDAEHWNEFIHAFGHANSETDASKLYGIFQTMRKENIK